MKITNKTIELISNNTLNNGILSDSSSVSIMKDYELGFVQNISTNDNLIEALISQY